MEGDFRLCVSNLFANLFIIAVWFFALENDGHAQAINNVICNRCVFLRNQSKCRHNLLFTLHSCPHLFFSPITLNHYAFKVISKN